MIFDGRGFLHQWLYGIAAFCFYGREHAGIRTYPWFLAAGERLEYSQSAGANFVCSHAFEYFDLKEEGALIRKAVDASLDANVRTPEIQVEGGDKYGTKEVGAWIVDYLKKS